MLLHLITWLHIAVIIFVSFYVFLFTKNLFDYVYLFYIYVVILHWTFFTGECFVSYLYKRLKYKDYKAGDNLNDNELTSLFDMKPRTVAILASIHILFVIFNLWVITQRNRIPLYLGITFIILLLAMYISFKTFKHHRTNKSYHLFLEIMKYIILVFGIFSVWIIRFRTPKARRPGVSRNDR